MSGIRLILGLLAAGLFLLLLGPLRAFAQWRGWRLGIGPTKMCEVSAQELEWQ